LAQFIDDDAEKHLWQINQPNKSQSLCFCNANHFTSQVWFCSLFILLFSIQETQNDICYICLSLVKGELEGKDMRQTVLRLICEWKS